jgi:glutamate/tyrosine decarboxylase-like PLP-dependent enzyme
MGVMTDLRALLARTADHVAAYREAASEAAVFPDVDLDAVRAAIGGRLPDGPAPAGEAVDQLVAAVEPAMVATTGPRYFGFVVGGALDAATAAEVLAVGWDQSAYNHLSSPVSAVVEEVAGAWLVELLGLPVDVSFGFVTGAQAANTVCLAAARHQVLAEVGWDVERNGLVGGPPVRVVASEERHATIDRSLRLLGLGAGSLQLVSADGNGAIDVAALETVLAGKPAGPTIVCLQSGNVNTGACDDLAGAVAAAHEHGAWAHVDGAFGLWAAASPATRPLVAGIETADSWGTDGHKWLNVPYDSGYAFCAHPDAHAAAMAYTAAYLMAAPRPPCGRPATTCLSRPAGRGGSRRGPRCASWGAAASPSSSTAAVPWPGASLPGSPPSTASRSSTTSS